jgi:hypothetical protein
MFTGDIVEYHSACYCGDGHFADWGPDTLDNIAQLRSGGAIAPGSWRCAGRVATWWPRRALDRPADFVESTYRPVAQRRRARRLPERSLGRRPRRL